MARLYRRGRVRAFQALFEAEFERVGAEVALEREGGQRLSAAEREHAERLVAGVQARREELDAIIREVAPAFPVPQLAVVDRTVLRIALYELLFNNAAVPVAAVINDAVELAKTFGSDSSRRFVNGVLGTVSRARLPAPEEALIGSAEETEEPSGAL
ncbi:MAG: transcription antitermination factor NusB [Chloroflexi bacterium]|nr:transcription antitermination factor NusB [Chloroflexota bacterium]MCZ6708621.1 transcription antitermination factor NusB [Chloroflexota bacterium]